LPYNRYRVLSLEGFYELLASSIRDLLVALDTKEDNLIAYNAIRKQVEIFLEIIEEKRKEEVTKN
jgi:hypothetical protein